MDHGYSMAHYQSHAKSRSRCHFALTIAISRIGQMKISAQLWPLGWSSYGQSPPAVADQLHRQLHLPHQQPIQSNPDAVAKTKTPAIIC